MDVKITFLNTCFDEKHLYYVIKQFYNKGPRASRMQVTEIHLWIKISISLIQCFDRITKTFDFDQNEDESCMYKKGQGCMMVFFILYVDGIATIRNDARLL